MYYPMSTNEDLSVFEMDCHFESTWFELLRVHSELFTSLVDVPVEPVTRVLGSTHSTDRSATGTQSMSKLWQRFLISS